MQIKFDPDCGEVREWIKWRLADTDRRGNLASAARNALARWVDVPMLWNWSPLLA